MALKCRNEDFYSNIFYGFMHPSSLFALKILRFHGKREIEIAARQIFMVK